MKEIQEFYNQFKAIQASYEGQKTNWNEKYLQLKKLYDNILNYRLYNSKNAVFYEWIQRKLQADVWEEIDRVNKLKEGV